jgi:hypothetical protein
MAQDDAGGRGIQPISGKRHAGNSRRDWPQSHPKGFSPLFAFKTASGVPAKEGGDPAHHEEAGRANGGGPAVGTAYRRRRDRRSLGIGEHCLLIFFRGKAKLTRSLKKGTENAGSACRPILTAHPNRGWLGGTNSAAVDFSARSTEASVATSVGASGPRHSSQMPQPSSSMRERRPQQMQASRPWPPGGRISVICMYAAIWHFILRSKVEALDTR